jgi:hypothetical protein
MITESRHAKPAVCALAVSLLTAALYLQVTWAMDRTTASTTNGIWKSPVVSEWAAKGTSGYVDSGGYLYPQVVAWLCNRVPSSWIDFGTPVPDPTFRKMAVVNCCLGGICAGLIFLLAWTFTGSALTSIALAVFHAACAFIIVNSINNEDIMPGFVCFLAAAVSLFAGRFQAAGVFGAALFCAAAMLLHWTLVPPAAAAIGVAALFAVSRDKTRLLIFGAALILFLFTTYGITELARMDLRLIQVLLPSKATTSGWVGLLASKWKFLAVGIAHYVAGGMNISDEVWLFRSPGKLLMFPSWILCALSVAACIRCSLTTKLETRLRALGAFGLVLFVVGQAENLYGQPQDPQMQIQPMLIIVIAGVVLAAEFGSRLSRATTLCAAGILTVSVPLFALNLRFIKSANVTDSESILMVQEMRTHFPADKTTLVVGGMEGWTSWDCILTFQGRERQCHEKTHHAIRSLTTGESLEVLTWQLRYAMCQGERVFATVVWNQTSEQFIRSVATLGSEQEIGRVYELLRRDTKVGDRISIRGTEFVEVLRTGGCKAPTMTQ